MSQCKRCTKRILDKTDELNHGYCEFCFVLVARELISNTPDFDFTEQDEAWRENTREIIVDMYLSIKRGGCPHPLKALGKPIRGLFWALLRKEDLDRLGKPIS